MDINGQLEQLKREFEEKKNALFEPARIRLNEIRTQIAELEREEAAIRAAMNLGGGGAGQKRTRKSGKRMTAQHKKEIVAKFITNGHIKDGMELNKPLRTALEDEGLMPYDLRKMNEFLPNGWEAEFNGQRGLSAKTVFRKKF